MGKLNFKNSAGFTLIEVIIIAIIIGVLGYLAINSLGFQIFKGNDAKRKSDLDRLRVAIEEYEKDHNCYPTAGTVCSGSDMLPYLDKIPLDPTTSLHYGYEVPPGSGGPWCPRWYRLYAKLENTNDSSITSVICTGACCFGSYNYKISSPNAP